MTAPPALRRLAVRWIPPLLVDAANFRRLWIGQTISVVGDQITLLGLPTRPGPTSGAPARPGPRAARPDFRRPGPPAPFRVPPAPFRVPPAPFRRPARPACRPPRLHASLP